nr:hypothetical protein [Tanacetum cinerariifolium]
MIPMQEKLKLSKSQGASIPAEKQHMQNIPYASANQDEEQWTAVKNILKYLRNTKDMFLVYGGNMERELRVSCYTNVGYLTDADNLKSQTGYVFVLNRCVVDWKSTKQSIFATSSIDDEYIAAFDASKEAVWIRKFISGLGIVPTIEEPISMYCDKTGAIAIAKDDGVTKVYGGDIKQELRVSCYTNAGYLTDADDLKSQTRYVFVFNGGVVDWKITKQSIFATLSAEAEYVAAFDAFKEVVWVRKFISGFGVVPTIEEPHKLYWYTLGVWVIREVGLASGRIRWTCLCEHL